MRLAIIAGAATPPGRLMACATHLAQLAVPRPDLTTATVDLHRTTLDVADGRPVDQCTPDTQSAIGRITDADAAIICSPTYRAAPPGVLKNLLDLLPLDALRGKPVGIVALGATDHHYLGVDTQLRAVLAWFGAVTVPVHVYLSNASFGPDKQPDPAAAEELESLCDTVVRMAGALSSSALGPAPLAGRRPG